MLLTARDALPGPTRDAIERLRDNAGTFVGEWLLGVTVLGGSAAVSDAVVAEIENDLGVRVRRLSGPDRFATAVEVAGEVVASPPVVFVATGLDFLDSLAGVPAATRRATGPLLLVTRDTVPEPTRIMMRALRPPRVVVLGGPAVVSDSVLAELLELADS